MKNMNPALFVSACLLCLSIQTGIAQVHPYKIRIGVFMGASLEAYKLTDNGGRVDDSANGFVGGGLEIDMEYTDVFSVGGGFLYKPYVTGLTFKGQQSSSISTDLPSLQFPLYLGARTYFRNSDAIVYALGGAAFAVNLNYNSGTSFETGTYSANGVIINESTEVDTRFKQTFPLVFVGAGWDGRIFSRKRYPESKDLRIAFSVRRYVGFSEIMRVSTEYVVNNTDTFLAEETYKGGHWMFSWHLIYAFER